jgi:hypothetical protein
VATTTTKLALTKPDGTDLVDIAVLNANADKIDTASGAFICTSTTRPASPWNGQLIFETDTLNALVYRTSSTSWNIVGGSTVSADPPVNAGSGNFWWDSDNGKLYIYYNDGNTSQWVSANSNTSGVPIVGNEAGRNSLYPTPAEGNSVYRTDTNLIEIYDGSAWKTSLGAVGGVVQVVTTLKNNIFTTTSTTFVDITDLSVSITPKSSANKILVLVSLGSTGTNVSGAPAIFNILRGSTIVSAPATGSNPAMFMLENTSTTASSNANFTVLDSPATTSAITYKVQVRTTTGTLQVNRLVSNAAFTQVSSITVMEIAG